MGYRSTFITDDKALKLPDWFLLRWTDYVNYNSVQYSYPSFPISSKFEGKQYGMWEELMLDIQRILNEDANIASWKDEYCVHLVFLHEDGLFNKYSIMHNRIFEGNE